MKATAASALEKKLQLTCLACKAKGFYSIGRAVITGDAIGLDDVGFTACVRCNSCSASGPWSFQAPDTALWLTSLLMRSMAGEKNVPLIRGKLAAFDGTCFRYGGEVEDYLLELISREPERAFLYTRLGNFYAHNMMDQRAMAMFESAVRLDPHDVESWCLLALLYRQNGEVGLAVRAEGEVLAQPRTPQETSLVRELRLQFEAKSRAAHEAGRPWRIEGAKVGRNQPCPCGSGRKFKKCCTLARTG